MKKDKIPSKNTIIRKRSEYPLTNEMLMIIMKKKTRLREVGDEKK